nr:DMSO/selenate family reductase complex A subunit [Plesiomonas shigelloides]
MSKGNPEYLNCEVSRRSFLEMGVKGGGALAVASSLSLPFQVNAKSEPALVTRDDGTKVSYSACLVNCGSRCPLKVHTKDGVIVRIDTENGINDAVMGEHQIRPCLRGRSVRWKTYNPDRLKTPMKRIGKRGEGKFVPISWDEATTILAEKLRYTIDKYGNEAVYYQYGSGSTGANIQGRSAGKRLLGLMGGFLDQYTTYSTASIGVIEPFLYGSPQASLLSDIRHSDFVLMFGQNIAETRMSGGGQITETFDALRQSGAKVVIVDPRRTDSVSAFNATWLPINPGTDAALVAAMVHTMLTEELIDEAQINRYAVGFDESTLPASAPANSSYKSYVLGLGADKTVKTPEWASQITGIAPQEIRQLARELTAAKAAWISQGWSAQRASNGEQTAMAIMLLPVITGQFGRPGTNSGNWGGNVSYPLKKLPFKNPVKASIPCFLWADAIMHGSKFTSKNSGLRGAETLAQNIKFIWSYASNVMMNQHSDLNLTHKILEDESQCEFIMVMDNHMTATARYADLLLPDCTSVESNDLVDNSYASGAYHYFIRLQNAIDPLFDNRPSYDVFAEVARKLGIEEQFTEGRDVNGWVEYCYEETRKMNPQSNLPPFAKTDGMGVVDRRLADSSKYVALQDYRNDPQANPLKTPSGKIEIYSERLATIAQEWTLPDPKWDKITPIPEYVPVREGVDGDPELLKKYPLVLTSFHTKGRTHSTYHSVAVLREAVPDTLWINPLDATSRGIQDGDLLEIFNDRGRVRMAAKVTPRIRPGVVSMPQGAWRKTNKDGVDVGGCINTLTTMHPSPLSKGNPQLTNLCEVKKV